MKTKEQITKRIEELKAQARNIKELAFNASEMKRGDVCGMLDELDEILEAKAELEADLRWRRYAKA